MLSSNEIKNKNDQEAPTDDLSQELGRNPTSMNYSSHNIMDNLLYDDHQEDSESVNDPFLDDAEKGDY